MTNLGNILTFAGLGFGCVTAVNAVAEPETPAIWLDYRRNPDAHPNIPNGAYAGYAYGEQEPPMPPVAVNAADSGAVGDGKTDATDAIRRALALAAEKGGGAVLLPAGTYCISGPIFLRYSGVVLRGEGADKTVLYASQPLEKGYGRNVSGGKSRWAWSGGMLWIAPEPGRADRYAGADAWREGWRDTERLTEIVAPARRGERTLEVADASRLAAGQRIILRMTDAGDHSMFGHMCGDVPGTKDYDWAKKARGIVQHPDWNWPVEIESVSGHRLTLRQPLRTDVRLLWKPHLRTLGPLVTEAGVERLTIRMAPSRLGAHLTDPGYNGVYFENAWNCWARDVVVRDCDNGIGTAAVKCVTVDRFRIEGRKCHHATYCRVESHDVLWTRFKVESPVHHGLNVEGLSTGNVWSAGDMRHGTFDSHRALPFENLRTDIRVCNDGGHGGSADAGPLFGARFCHWNIQVLNGRPHMIHCATMMPMGAVVGVRGTAPEPRPYPDFPGPLGTIVEADGREVTPRDLHVAQLALRMGKPPPHLGRDIEATLHRADGTRIMVRWTEPFPAPRTYAIARSVDGGDWREEFAIVEGSDRAYADTQVEPGRRYAYRVRARVEGAAPRESAPVEMINRPAPVQGLSWSHLDGTSGIRLAWRPSEETAGTLRVQRQPSDGGETSWSDVAALEISATEYTDRAVGEGARYRYRVWVANASGESEPVIVNAFVRAQGTRLYREDFAVRRDAVLPATGEGPNRFGIWRQKGVNGGDGAYLCAGQGSSLDGHPPDGMLAWPNRQINSRSFVWCEDFSADLSDVGAEISFDYAIGRSGISTHVISMCFRLADGAWIASTPRHTEPMPQWYGWRRLVSDETFLRFDPEQLAVGERIAAPDFRRVTGLGFFITRPIHQRYLHLDNLRVWAKPLSE